MLWLQRYCGKVDTNNWLGPSSFDRSSKTEPDEQKNCSRCEVTVSSPNVSTEVNVSNSAARKPSLLGGVASADVTSAQRAQTRARVRAASGRGRRRVLHAIAVTAPEFTSLCWTPYCSRTEHSMSLYVYIIYRMGPVPISLILSRLSLLLAQCALLVHPSLCH